MRRFEIHEDIAAAETPPAAFYTDPDWYAEALEKVHARGWHAVPDLPALAEPGSVVPFVLQPDGLREPLVLVRGEDGTLRAFANVCSHRGNLVVQEPGVRRGLRCEYHGRRFDLAGAYQSMPEMEGARDFPRPCDSLRPVALGTWGPLHFVSLDPEVPLEQVLAPLEERMVGMPVDRLEPEPADTQDYEFDGNWALYNDNYLEGFHVPYVHPELARYLDYKAYRTLPQDHAVVQVGNAREGELAFSLPPGHPDHPDPVAGLYFWLFPSTMLNFYPWGLSLNIVEPLGHARTRVRYRSWVWDRETRGQGAGGVILATESQDQHVVGTTWRGLQSRSYRRGRYSPTQERGVHHFHRLLSRYLG